MSFRYPGGPAVVRDVSLAAAPGQVTMLLGQSGSGKTTLVKLARGLLRPSQGSVVVLGQPLRPRPGRGRLDPSIAYIPQQLGLVRGQTAVENAAAGALAGAGPASLFALPGTQIARARALLESLGLGPRALAPVAALSGGERQRVAIARALMQGARVILADELVSQLDPVTTEGTMQIIRRIAGDGVTVLMTTHELGLVTRYADQAVVLRAGQVVLARRETGIPPEVLAAALA